MCASALSVRAGAAAANRRFARHHVAALHHYLPEPHVRLGTRQLERDRPFQQRLAARQRLGLRQERPAHLQCVAERDERVHVGRLDLDGAWSNRVTARCTDSSVATRRFSMPR